MKVQKMGSLTPETAKKASEMENFSLYIRHCLRGTQHMRLEFAEKRIQELKELIVIAVKHGSAHRDFAEPAKQIYKEMKK